MWRQESTRLSRAPRWVPPASPHCVACLRPFFSRAVSLCRACAAARALSQYIGAHDESSAWGTQPCTHVVLEARSSSLTESDPGDDRAPLCLFHTQSGDHSSPHVHTPETRLQVPSSTHTTDSEGLHKQGRGGGRRGGLGGACVFSHIHRIYDTARIHDTQMITHITHGQVVNLDSRRCIIYDLWKVRSYSPILYRSGECG